MEEKKPNQCVLDGCDLDRYGEHDKCILHCDKSTRAPNSELESILFYQTLPITLAKNNAQNISNINLIIDYFNITGSDESDNEVIINLTNKFRIKDIVFPASDRYHMFFFLLSKLGQIVFSNCSFYFSSLPEFNNNYYFEYCKFHEPFSESSVFKREITYSYCIFHTLYIFKQSKQGYLYFPTFETCFFQNSFHLDNLSVTSLNLNDNHFESIILTNTTIDDSFYMPYCDSFLVQDGLFKSDIIYNRTTNAKPIDLILKNVEIYKTLDIANINLKSLELVDTSVNSLNAFNLSCATKPFIAGLSVTGKTNMHKAIFKQGLDLDGAYFSGDCFFKEIQIANTSSRETYRVIKATFDKEGNSLEANKYFALEMKAYERELKENGGTKSERFLLWVNRVTSDYGQNFIRPILILVFFNLFLAFNVFLYKNANSEVFNSRFLSWISDFLNIFAGLILPFKEFLIKGHDFLTLIITIINGVLIYQTIVALKRKTRR